MIISYGTEDYHIMCTVIQSLPLQCLGKATDAQIFATNIGCSCLFPMKLRSEAHIVLSLLFQQDEVPLIVICDDAKEMVLGKFNRKLKETWCHLKQVEPFTPWSNEAEKERKEPKKSSGRKHIKSHAQ